MARASVPRLLVTMARVLFQVSCGRLLTTMRTRPMRERWPSSDAIFSFAVPRERFIRTKRPLVFDQSNHQVGDLAAFAFLPVPAEASVLRGHAEPGKPAGLAGFDDLRAEVK